ncbi:hypothetical protein CGRA01v4_05172 [Colletotrichum graminicola]|nr:hypothetical protein CGRA01v4_05172 [Colletotrichum graminicola]
MACGRGCSPRTFKRGYGVCRWLFSSSFFFLLLLFRCEFYIYFNPPRPLLERVRLCCHLPLHEHGPLVTPRPPSLPCAGNEEKERIGRRGWNDERKATCTWR